MKQNPWFFIVGGSSGFGLASAKIMAEKKYNLFIVHRDRKARMTDIENEFNNLRSHDIFVVSVNTNANDPQNQATIIESLKTALGEEGKIKLFLHSIADGNLGSIAPSLPTDRLLTDDAFAYTIESMGSSFISWSKKLHEEKLFSSDARIIGLTSEGTHKVMKNYAAVAAAKAVLESGCKYLAVELAPHGIHTNLINAGITDTPALKCFAGHDDIIATAKKRNPSGRLTTVEDVARVVYLLSTEEAAWINGTVIRVDGGEQLL